MAPEEVNDLIINRLKGRKKTLSEISADINAPKQVLKDRIAILVSEGIISKVGHRYFVAEESVLKEGITEENATEASGTEKNISRITLSETEWRVIKYVQSNRQKKSNLDDVAKDLGMEAARAAISKLVAAGILVEMAGTYGITATSAMRIPLSGEERMLLQASEDRIDKMVEEIHPRQIEVAEELRKIRDGKLYRETHGKFQNYVEERFDRTRDWAYKVIRDLEVLNALNSGNSTPNVESLLQTVTTREMPHLAKLKKDPKKMQLALQTADERAKGESRLRSTDDTKKAVEELLASAKPQQPPRPPQKVRRVELEGIAHQGGTTDDVALWLIDFAKWFRKHPTDSGFSINFGKAA